MDTEKMREQFEQVLAEVFLKDGYSEFSTRLMFERGSDGEYRSPRVHGAWWAWQASREAVVVHMPNRASDAYREYFDDVEGGSLNEAAYIRDVRKAIEGQGLKVAP